MASDSGEGEGTPRTHQIADERDGHLEGEDTTPLLGRIEALERAMRAAHSSATQDNPSVAKNSSHGRQLIMTNNFYNKGQGSHDVILHSAKDHSSQPSIGR